MLPADRPPRDLPGRAAAVLSRTVLGLVLLAAAVAPDLLRRWAWLVLLGGLLAGLPHGAVDHLVPRFRMGRSAPPTAAVVAGYAAVSAVTLAAFRAWPGPALVVFVAASAVHFGTGETAFAAQRAGRAAGLIGPARLAARELPAAAASGAAAVVLPLVAHPAQVAPVVRLLVPGSSGHLPAGPTRWTAVAVLLLVAATLVRHAVRRRPAEAADLALLTGVVLAAPPLAAFGAYFGGWHAVRHTARLLAEDPANGADLQAGRLGRPLGRFARQAAAPTLAALAVVLGLWAAAGGWQALVASDLTVLAALTAPHMVMVAWLDRQAQPSAASGTAPAIAA